METRNSVLNKPKGWGTRHTLAILGFTGMACNYAMRFNLSIAIVAMVGSKASSGDGDDNGQNNHTACAHLIQDERNGTGLDGSPAGDAGEFDWSGVEQGFILGSFFWGYVATQLIGGILASRYGGKWPLGLGIFLTALVSLLIPVAARTHKHFLVACRVLQGMGEGVTLPAMHAILAKWAPADEKSIMTSVVYAGTNFGTAVALVMSGYLIDAGVMGGWPSVFYIFGIFSIVWFVFWAALMRESPNAHPGISTSELMYIEKSIGTVESSKKMPTPWTSMLSSVPFWAIQVGHAGHDWGLYTLLALMPTYMKSVLQFDIKQNSWMSATPYIVMWAVSIFASQIADILISRRIFKTVTVRKLAQAISQIVPAIALIGASFSGCDRHLTVSLLTLGVGINGVVYAGFIANHAEIASNFAGIMMGITNTVSNLSGVGAPYVAGLIINNEPSLENWRLVFVLSAAIYFFNAIFYGIFASATEQPWNKIPGAVASGEKESEEDVALKDMTNNEHKGSL